MKSSRTPKHQQRSTKAPAQNRARYWRTFRRKLGEGLDLAGKALTAAAAAATFSPLATKGDLVFPTGSVASLFAVGLVLFLLGIHLQAKAKPDA